MIRLLLAIVLSLAAAGAACAQQVPFDRTWLYPGGASYAAGLGDDNKVISALNAGGALTVTLPSTTAMAASGWQIAVENDAAHTVTVQVNGTAGGHILYPTTSGGASATSFSTAAGNNEIAVVEYDGNGNFRIVAATPATALALGFFSGGSVPAAADLLGSNGSAFGGVTVGTGLSLSGAFGAQTLSATGGGVAWSTSVYTLTTTPLVLPATNYLIEIVRQSVAAPITVDLAAAPPANFVQCVKDGGNNFQANAATIKTTDGTAIDAVAGSTGYVMNQARQFGCFIFDGTQWDII
ncbi:MAG TPA: hypothetical protein VMS01_04180 [Stellaceae bacterium]|nr:hypothetical protein [Stellaceae bacterium]